MTLLALDLRKAAPERPRLSALLRLLLLTQLAFNIGFYAVLPFLAEHLGQAIGMAGWLVGFVLGLRTFSQQGLFVVGGALADRYGIRPVVLAGCVLRIAGFVWLGYARQTWAVIGAVLLIGFAAALFSPAVESEVARQAVVWEESGGGSRTRVLALLTVAGQAGAFVGPLLGALLLSVDFRTVCLAGAGVFVLVLAGHAWLLPQHIPGRGRVEFRGGMGKLLRNRRFLALCCAYGAYLLAYNQLYLALPDEVERATGSQAALAWLFALSSLLVVTAQLPVTRWVGERLSLRRSMVAGLLLISAGRGRVRRPAHPRPDARRPGRPRLGPRPRGGGPTRPLHRRALLGLRPDRPRRQLGDRHPPRPRPPARRALAHPGGGTGRGDRLAATPVGSAAWTSTWRSPARRTRNSWPRSAGCCRSCPGPRVSSTSLRSTASCGATRTPCWSHGPRAGSSAP
jgi:MFS family permease